MYDEKLIEAFQLAFQNAVTSLRIEHNEKFYYYAFIFDEGKSDASLEGHANECGPTQHPGLLATVCGLSVTLHCPGPCVLRDEICRKSSK